MKGALLFFVTLVMVVPTGREAVNEYANDAIIRLAAQSPFSEVVLVSIGIIAALLMIILREQHSAPPPVYVIRREERGPAAIDFPEIEEALPEPWYRRILKASVARLKRSTRRRNSDRWFTTR